jgi:hypothetical protein
VLAQARGRIDGSVYIDLADAKTGVRAVLESAGFAAQPPLPACCSAATRASTTWRAPAR